jgi:hypothetical protein
MQRIHRGESELVEIAPQRAPTCVPPVVRAGAAILRIFQVPEDAPVLAFLHGTLARRYTATWEHGRFSGAAEIELLPASRDTTEVMLHLDRPFSFRAPLWTKSQLTDLGHSLASALAVQIAECRFARI